MERTVYETCRAGWAKGQDDAVPRMPLVYQVKWRRRLVEGCHRCGLFDRCQMKCMSIAWEYIYWWGGGAIGHSCFFPPIFFFFAKK